MLIVFSIPGSGRSWRTLKKNPKKHQMELTAAVLPFLLSEDIQGHWCCPETTWAQDYQFIPLGLNTKPGAQIIIGSPRTLLGLDLSTQKRSVFFHINFQLFFGRAIARFMPCTSLSMKITHCISNTLTTSSFMESLWKRERCLIYIHSLMPL